MVSIGRYIKKVGWKPDAKGAIEGNINGNGRRANNNSYSNSQYNDCNYYSKGFGSTYLEVMISSVREG